LIAIDIKKEIEDLTPELVELRRLLHRHPEPGFQEVWTGNTVAEKLRELGYEVKSGIAKTGVMGLLRGGKPGKTLLLRADIDALTIEEKNELDYRSEDPGAMHACGHDGHMAIALTVAKILSRHRTELSGNIKYIFQPAEEGPGGAKPMIEEGVLNDPRPDRALGLHLWNMLPVGTVGIRPGPTFACLDAIDIIIKGKGGHGAAPHQTVDAIVASAQVITALQTMVSREVDPIKPVVLSIGTIEGGDAYNIIAHDVRMKGTVRAFDLDLRKTLPERIERIIQGVTSGMRAEYEFDYRFGYPPLVNDEGVCDWMREIAAEVVGEENIKAPDPTMGGEDMAYFLQEVAGCYFLLGSANEEKGLNRPHHHPEFNFDEAALPLGVEILARAALRFLS
jgi:amidohydrolase